MHNTGITQFPACSIVILCTLHYAGVAVLTLADCRLIPTQRICIQRSLTSRKNPKLLLLLIYHRTAFHKRISSSANVNAIISLKRTMFSTDVAYNGKDRYQETPRQHRWGWSRQVDSLRLASNANKSIQYSLRFGQNHAYD